MINEFRQVVGGAVLGAGVWVGNWSDVVLENRDEGWWVAVGLIVNTMALGILEMARRIAPEVAGD